MVCRVEEHHENDAKNPRPPNQQEQSGSKVENRSCIADEIGELGTMQDSLNEFDLCGGQERFVGRGDMCPLKVPPHRDCIQ